MVDEKLIDYIKFELSRGNSLESIKQILISRGWQESDINKAIKVTNSENHKSSKKWIILVFIIIIAGGIVAFLIFSKDILAENKKLGGIIDCKTDLDCFIDSSNDCSKSKVTNIISIDIFGVNNTYTSLYEIKELQENKCIFYMKTEKVDLKFTDALIQQMLDNGATQEQIQQQEQEANNQAKLSEGKEQTCKFIITDLTEMLNRWKEGNFDYGETHCELSLNGNNCTTIGGDFGAAECTGNMYE